MIRNDSQLKKAQHRLHTVEQLVAELKDKYSGQDLFIRVDPLIDEIAELRSEVREFLELRQVSLEDAVSGILRKPILLDNIGQLLSKLRIAAGLTQAEVADQLEWHQSNVSRFESDSYSSHNLSKVLDYADALGVWLHILPSMEEEVEALPFQMHDFFQYPLIWKGDAEVGSDAEPANWRLSQSEGVSADFIVDNLSDATTTIQGERQTEIRFFKLGTEVESQDTSSRIEQAAQSLEPV